MRIRWPLITLVIIAVALSGHIVAQTVISEDDATTSSVRELLQLTRTTTGTPAAGIGAELTFDIEDAGGTEQQAGIAVVLDDVTDGAEDATMTFTVNQGGTLTEFLRLDGTDGHVGFGATTPDSTFEIDDAGNIGVNIDCDAAAEEARLIMDGEEEAALRFYEGTEETARLHYDSTNTRFTIMTRDDPSLVDTVRMEDGTDDIECNGTFSDSNFGPCEWVIGSAPPGRVVCLTGARKDADGELRATVTACDHVACSRVIGVTVPADQGVQYGRPKFDFMDTFESHTAWEGTWRSTHVGIELTGFRMVPVVGPVAVGDLLVSAGREGRAMAMAEPGPGTIIGKAAQASDGPVGSIWVRVHLQSGYGSEDQIRALEAADAELRATVEALESRVARLRTRARALQDDGGSAR